MWTELPAEKDIAKLPMNWWWQGRHSICGRSLAYQVNKAPVPYFFPVAPWVVYIVRIAV